METLVGVITMGLGLMVQLAVVGRINLLGGHADMILVIVASWALQVRVKSAWIWGLIAGLLVGIVSGLPLYLPVLVYAAVVGMAVFFERRVWQVPLLAMFAITFSGSFLMNILTFLVLKISGSPYSFSESFSLVILPSILLTMLLAIPMHAVVRELTVWLLPKDIES